jgi:hypothetical protein
MKHGKQSIPEIYGPLKWDGHIRNSGFKEYLDPRPRPDVTPPPMRPPQPPVVVNVIINKELNADEIAAFIQENVIKAERER